MSYYEDDHWDWCACGRRKKAAFSTCWQCKQESAEHEAYMRGFHSGHESGFLLAQQFQQAQQKLHPELVKRLIQLCHPDKHGGSQAATEVTQWLLTQR